MPRPPERERLLLDADVTPQVDRLLRLNGFRTISVLDVDQIDETDDVAIVRWARKHRMLLTCFDLHEDHQTKLAWIPEIVRRGGRVLQISEGPGQAAEMAAGKVLMHHAQWARLFKEHRHGVATINRASVKFFTRADLADKIPAPRTEADWQVLLRAMGRERAPGRGRPGRGGRPRPPPQTGKRLL